MIRESELILNPDGSIYHLHLRPEQVARTIITVGDPDRVNEVSKHFDRIEHRVSHREFVTHTGRIGEKRISVIATGIGPDNIDIVLNEIDALFNIDLETRKIREIPQKLRFIRIGTSGSLRPEIPLDALLISSHAIALDNLWAFYDFEWSAEAASWREALRAQVPDLPAGTAIFEAPGRLSEQFGGAFLRGITLTCPGFYAPQGRVLRLGSRIRASTFENLRRFRIGKYGVTNMEMETAAIYGMAGMLGHEAISCNAILANRAEGSFSNQAGKTVERLILKVLESISNS